MLSLRSAGFVIAYHFSLSVVLAAAPTSADVAAAQTAWAQIAGGLRLPEVTIAESPSDSGACVIPVVLEEYQRLYESVTDETPPAQASTILAQLDGIHASLVRTTNHAFLRYEIDQRLSEVRLRAFGQRLNRPPTRQPIHLPETIPLSLLRNDEPGIMAPLLRQFDERLDQALAPLSVAQRLILLQGLISMGREGTSTRLPEALQIELTSRNQMSRFYGAMQARALERLAAFDTPEAMRLIARSVLDRTLYPLEITNPDGGESSVSTEWVRAWYHLDRAPAKRRAISEAAAEFRRNGSSRSNEAAEELENILRD